MPRFLALINFTDKGVANIRNSLQRAEEFKSSLTQSGGKVIDIYWAIGQFDGAVIFEAANEAAATGLLLNLGSHGFVRTKTMRIFNEAEFKGVLDSMR